MNPAPIRPIRISPMNSPQLQCPMSPPDTTLPPSNNRRLKPGGSLKGMDLHCCAEVPGPELVLAVAELLALRALARGRIQDHLEDTLADLLERGRAVGDLAAVDVHVVF